MLNLLRSSVACLLAHDRPTARPICRFVLPAIGLAVGSVLAGCGGGTATQGSTQLPGTRTTEASAERAAVVRAWRAAENALYEAEANPAKASSLSTTLVNPELALVRRNLESNKARGFIGRGHWDLGDPKVTQVTSHPTTATVVSCIKDAAILVNKRTGKNAGGIAGTPDWIHAISTMTLTRRQEWKLSHQAATIYSNRSMACASV